MPHELPLQQWRLRNFKSVREATIDLAPLTVLVGPNSSGKSSLIQSILMWVQAARSFVDEPRVPLNGVYVSLGEFADLRTEGPGEHMVGVGGVFSFGSVESPIDWRDPRTDRRRTAGVPSRLEWAVELVEDDDPVAPRGSAAIGALTVSVSEPGAHRGLLELAVRAAEVQEVDSAAYPNASRLSGTLAGPRGSADEVDAVVQRAGVPIRLLARRPTADLFAESFMKAWESAHRHSFPGVRRRLLKAQAEAHTEEVRRLSLSIEAFQRSLEQARRLAIDSVGEPEEAGDAGQQLQVPDLASLGLSEDSMAALLRAVGRYSDRRPGQATREDIFDELERDGDLAELLNNELTTRSLQVFVASHAPEQAGDGTKLVERGGAARRLIAESHSLFDYFRRRIAYLGPLREKPQAMYRVVQTEASEDVGITGQHTAAVLYRHRNRRILAPLPMGDARQATLGDAVDSWVREFGLAEHVRTNDMGRHGFELLVDVAGLSRPLDTTSVGVGVSQVLPVLVRVLLASPGELVMLEQPELHLHPKLQQKLGDFLLRASQSGRQILVETHSDHLVTRLRRRIAEADDESIGDLVRLLFVYQEDGGTTYRPVDINEFGGIDEWPPGFFDQGVEDVRQLVQAGLEKKRRRTNPNPG